MATLENLMRPHPRVRVLREGRPDPDGRCVVHWMQRAQRGRENAAVNLAVAVGNALRKPVISVFGLTPAYPSAQRRHYRFLLEGLVEARDALAERGVPLVVRLGSPPEVAVAVARAARAAMVVGDENPVRVGERWRRQAAAGLTVPLRLVDADVVVPTSLFPKQEYAARTIRPKIHRVLEDYLRPTPDIRAEVPCPAELVPSGEVVDVEALLERLGVGGVGEVPGYVGGWSEARRRLKRFLEERLPVYATERNEPVPYRTSELSAHLHFGQIGPTTIALAARDSGAPPECVEAYLEELIVRRELAINYVARNPDYDRLAGCPEWGRKTLAKHASDPRPVIYTERQLEAGQTGDALWNAAQKEMILTGRMHNYLRMYWAKKILEWTPDPEAAFDLTVRMNDTYFLDGRDPNGYVGAAWAIGGLHDRPWGERPIFGTIRYMGAPGMRRKIDVEAYIRWVSEIERRGWREP
jgi:deoxyribodipyrimidine photo-lyase